MKPLRENAPLPERRRYARELARQGMEPEEIGPLVDRATRTVAYWLNPEALERERLRDRDPRAERDARPRPTPGKPKTCKCEAPLILRNSSTCFYCGKGLA